MLIEGIKVNKFLLIASMILLMSIVSCKKNLESSPENLPYTIGEILLSDDFTGNLSLWSIEGEPPKIIDGQLKLESSAFSAMWLKPSLLGNVIIEYDVTVPGRNESAGAESSFGCFAMATDPANPNKFFAAGKERAGELSMYNNLNLYYIELGCNKKKSVQVLRYSDGKKKRLNKKANSTYQIASDQKYHIKLLFFEKTIEFYLNGRRLLRHEDSQPYTRGNFGLTTMANSIIVENFVITHLQML